MTGIVSVLKEELRRNPKAARPAFKTGLSGSRAEPFSLINICMKMREIINMVEQAQTVKPRFWFLSNEMIDEDIIAYHGTPHDFDKFDISKIGTGEGAAAFGHGLYFADNENIAKIYRDNISYQQVWLRTKPRTP